MQRVAGSAEEEMIVKVIREETPWEKLPKRLKLFLSSNEEYQKRVKDYCIKKRFKWNDCAARSACRENEYYEDLMGYLRKNLALFPYHLAENVCRVLRISPFRYYCDMLYDIMRNERPYDSIPNFSAADVLRLTGIGRNEFIDIMNKCKAKKLMWKLNKSIVKDFLPTVPVDFPVEPWWTVAAVNLTVEEFRKISEEERAVMDKVGKEEFHLVAELDLEIVRVLYRRGLIYFEVPVYPDDHFQVSNLDGFVSNRDQSYEDPTEQLLYAVFVASSSQVSISELAQTLQAELSQLEAAVSLASRLGWAKKVLDLSSLLNDSLIPGSPLSEGSAGDEAFRPFGSTPSSPLQEGMSEFDSEIMRPHSGVTRFALMVDANLTSYLMMGSLSPGLKGHAVTLYEAGKLGDASVAEMCEDLRQVEGTKFEGELQQLANHAFSVRHALECLRTGGTGLTISDAAGDVEQDFESPDLGGFQLEPSAISLSSTSNSREQFSRLSSFAFQDQSTSSPAADLPSHSGEGEDFGSFRFAAADEGFAAGPIPTSGGEDPDRHSSGGDVSSEVTPAASSSSFTDPSGRTRSRNRKGGGGGGRKSRVDVLRVESLQGLSQGTIHRVVRRDYDVIVSMIPLPSAPSIVSADGSGPVHFGPPSRAAITPWMKLLLYSVSGSGPVSVALIRGQRLRLLPPPLSRCAKALVWAWDGVGVGGVGGNFEGTPVDGSILLFCLNSLLKYTAVLVQPFSKSHFDERGLLLTKNIPLPLINPSAETKMPYEQHVQMLKDDADVYHPSLPLLNAANELNLNTAGYIRVIRVLRGNSSSSSTSGAEGKCWEWVPQSVEFGLPLFDTELCKRVCEGAVQSEVFHSSTLGKHHEAMMKLRRKLWDFISDHMANGPISRLAYSAGQLQSVATPTLRSQASGNWNPTAGMYDPVHSPSAGILSPSNMDFTNAESSWMAVLPLPPVLQPGKKGLQTPPRTESISFEQKADYVEDDDSSDVPLPGVNLIFDGKVLSPLDMAVFLQGRLPVVLIAEVAAATEMLRNAAIEEKRISSLI